MLVLNEVAQQSNLSTYIKFSKIGCFHSGAISALLTQNSGTKKVLKNYSIILICVAKLVDIEFIDIETLEQWYRLKIYGVSLMHYLEDRKINLLCREIISSTGI